MESILGKGVCDPHIHIFNNLAYLYASHDLSPENTYFAMSDWWIWSSDDLVNWRYESTLKPEDTYIAKPSKGCWATDAASKNGKYYWYFSDVQDGIYQIGVVVADTPIGPWKDPIGKPLIQHDPLNKQYDPAVFQEEDGTSYIVFGSSQYYIAKLNEDMITLAESPRKITILNPEGPYGTGKTDDKPFLHKRGEYYYLSWGCFYAMSHCVYGPYECKSSIISEEYVNTSFKAPTYPKGIRQGRHGSFFEWHNQWYFAFGDMSRSGNRFYRDSWISYVKYRRNGEIAPIVIEPCGVGRYFVDGRKIPASNYFKANGVQITEDINGDFAVKINEDGAFLEYPNIQNLTNHRTLALCCGTNNKKDITIEIRNGTVESELIGKIDINSENNENEDFIAHFTFPETTELRNLCIVFRGTGVKDTKFKWFEFHN